MLSSSSSMSCQQSTSGNMLFLWKEVLIYITLARCVGRYIKNILVFACYSTLRCIKVVAIKICLCPSPRFNVLTYLYTYIIYVYKIYIYKINPNRFSDTDRQIFFRIYNINMDARLIIPYKTNAKNIYLMHLHLQFIIN